MGYVAHHAVLVTADAYVLEREWMPDVDEFKANLPGNWGSLITGPHRGIINDYVTWVFLPDGSKEGWPDSDDGDRHRQHFADLFALRYEDESTPFNVVLVGYDENAVTLGANDPRKDWKSI